MKIFLLAGGALALVTGANLSPAMAEANPPPRWDTSPTMYQPTEPDTPDAVTASPPYEYQYHYGGSPRHPHWELQHAPIR